MKEITGINLRIARECIGCGETILSQLDPLRGVLVCGAPASGKTTLLRDMARALSYPYKVSLIDERNELSATANGRCENDIGLCDVYVGYPKNVAVMQAVRCMSPDIIVCDEVGDEKEIAALRYAFFCGAAFIVTVHSDSEDRAVVRELMSTHAFTYLVMLDARQKAGRVRRILCSD